jgi:hypothetical protein
MRKYQTTNGIESYFGHLENHLDLALRVNQGASNQLHQVVYVSLKTSPSFEFLSHVLSDKSKKETA